MIVKNESAIIRRCLSSVKPLIDRWLIIDTGSTDNTKQLIEEELAGIPGQLVDRPWVNFGHNRSELTALAKGEADYLLLVDADNIVRTSSDFKKSFDADAYFIRSVGDVEYDRYLLVRGSLEWQYIGATHEYIYCAERRSDDHLDSLWVEHLADGGTRPEKYQRDLRILSESLEQDPENQRTVFYLAQTYRDMGDHSLAIEYYLKRASMGGWEEEVAYSMFQVGELYGKLDRWGDAVNWFLKAYETRPTRAEPLHAICSYYRRSRCYRLGYLFAKAAVDIPLSSDILFIHRSVYDYMIADELSICAYYVGNHAESARLCEDLLRNSQVPDQERSRIEANHKYAVNALATISGDRPV